MLHLLQLWEFQFIQLMPRVTKRLIYQRADWQARTTLTLQQAFVAAYRTRRRRIQKLDEEGNALREMINVREIGGRVFGKLVTYTKGMRQETVKTNRSDDADHVESSQPPPPGEEWSGGALYVMMDGDHVGLAQSQSLRIEHLEEYLNWHLTRTGVIDGNAVSLRSLASAEARKILNKVLPTAVTFTRPVELGREDTVTANRTFTGDGAVKACRELLGVADLREVFPDEALDSGRVRTQIKFSWSQKVGGQRPDLFLRGMGRVALRTMDQDPSLDVKIETPEGDFSSRQLSLAKSKSLNAPDGVVPTLDVYRLIGEYIEHLRETRQIAD